MRNIALVTSPSTSLAITVDFCSSPLDIRIVPVNCVVDVLGKEFDGVILLDNEASPELIEAVRSRVRRNGLTQLDVENCMIAISALLQSNLPVIDTRAFLDLRNRLEQIRRTY